KEINSLPDGRNLMMFRDEYIFLVPLYDVFDVEDAITNPCEGLVVVVEGDGGMLMGFIVDDLVNQQQVVIKSLETNYELIEGVSGATILGNGRVSLIIDIATVQEMVSRQYAEPQKYVTETETPSSRNSSLAQTSMEVH
ncbi:MAG: chemotaxis protein CheW, partial [Emcibacter sp.]|nr:chemotaxis protein CheW [Emcibacter sp.]